ncbi:PEP-CTERM sorting domain-containing protein [Planctomycetales bacterium ZRK34]|nr:PEP-CTERM sorting domain-containing protein [Planctomycetales bacterium ZRK34]
MRWNPLLLIVTTAALFLAGSGVGSLEAATVLVSLDPAATYTHTLNPASPGTGGAYNDSAPNSTSVDLAAMGITPGQLIRLTRLGAYQSQGAANPAEDNKLSLIAVFSSSSTISSDHTLLNRIPGAIDAGTDFVTNNNAISGESSDITEDFLVASADGTQTFIEIIVPTGGAFLYFAVNDSYWADNKDPVDDFGASITLLPEPSSLGMLSIGAMVLVRRRR